MASRGVRALGRYTVSVVLQPYRDRTDWYVVRKRGGDASGDRSLLSRGSLTYDVDGQGPRDLIRDLRRIAFALERQFAQTRPEGAPEPPRGGYGGDVPLPGLYPPDWTVLHDGRALDTSVTAR